MPLDLVKLVRASQPFVTKYTAAVLMSRDGDHGVAGSGVLFQVDTAHFLLTAAHILACNHEERATLQLGGFDGESIPLEADGFATDVESTDVAVLEISPETAGALRAAGKAFARSATLDANDPTWTREGFYVVCGFPLADARLPEPTELHLTAYSHGADRALQNPPPIKAFDPKKHISVTYNNVARSNQDGGYIVKHPTGMSGGGIWRVGYPDVDSEALWSTADIRLVAIQHTYSDPSVNGTRIGWCLRIIHDRYPALRPALDLVTRFA